MCFDPVSLTIAALGEAASVGGGIMNAQAQADQAAAIAQDNANAAAASNKVLSAFEDTQAANQATNNASLTPVYGAIDPATFQANQAAIAQNEGDQASKAIAATLASVPQPTLTNTDNGQSAKAIADRIASRTGVSVQDAQNAAKLNSFGQAFSDLGLTETDANRKIDTVNTNARAQAALLPTDEQNAALQARRYIAPADTMTGTALQGLGNLFATVGGSGLAKSGLSGLSNIFSIGNPSISNTMGPTGFSVGGA